MGLINYCVAALLVTRALVLARLESYRVLFLVDSALCDTTEYYKSIPDIYKECTELGMQWAWVSRGLVRGSGTNSYPRSPDLQRRWLDPMMHDPRYTAR